ncbi:MAG: arylsulfatase A-like enzyme [Cyclobacteriaceae bacterium]|jgi:arylsulfatase A-like enzyme
MIRINRSGHAIIISLILLLANLLLTGCGNSSIANGNKSQLTKTKPNIIIILADDAGYADFGFMGSKDIQTPHLDQLANDGVIFKDAHVTASVCSPSRAGLLTGRYQQRFGHECNLEPDQQGAFDSAEVTIAEFLKTKDYQTSIFGKWHLGEEPHQHPLANGFDYFWGFLAGSRNYFPDNKQDKKGNSHAILENRIHTKFDGYLTDVIGEKAVDYISSRDKENPFFMYLSFNAPHTPMHAKEETIAMFGSDHKRPVYAAMLWSMDEAVGKVVSTLKQQGDYENTLIFFLSDNGGAHNNDSSVEPFKGWKGNQYEGGTRVPFTVTWKGTIPSSGEFSGLSSSLDIYKTVISFWNDEKSSFDGTDLLPFLTGEQLGDPHDQLFWQKGEMATVRSNDYKYITLQDSITVMYDLKNDLMEEIDIQKSYPVLADSLKWVLTDWQKQMKKPLWTEPEKWNQVTRRIYLDLMHNRPNIIKEPSDLYQLGQKEMY